MLFLNKRTYCTKEEAVALMLNLLSIKVFMGHGCSEANDLNLFSETEPFSLSELLNDYRCWYQTYMDEDEKITKPDELARFDEEYVKQAKIYLCLIDDELVKGAESQLRCIDDNKITLGSLERWVEDMLGFSIFDTMSFESKQITELNRPPPQANDLSSSPKLSTLVTLYLMYQAFIDRVNKDKSGTVQSFKGEPNQSNIAEYLAKFAKENGYQSGQSKSSIKKYLAAAAKEATDNKTQKP